MEEYERACCIQGYHGYKVTDYASARPCPRYPSPLACLQGQSLALADNYPWDPEDHPSTQSSFELTYWYIIYGYVPVFCNGEFACHGSVHILMLVGIQCVAFVVVLLRQPCVMNETRLTLLFSHSTFFAILPLL